MPDNHIYVNITNLLTEWQFWLNNVYKLFFFNYISHADCKIDNSKLLTRFWRAPVLATCGYQGNKLRKIEAASPKLCIKITLQEDNDISNAYAKDCICLNSF